MSSLFTSLEAQNKLVLNSQDVVVFAGGTNMVRMQKAGYLETLLTDAFADSVPRFRDLSWEADTVFRQGSVIERWRKDGFGDLEEQLKRIGATVVFAQFGKLESSQGKNGLRAFVTAYESLIAEYEKQGLQIILVSPIPFEKPANQLIPDVSKQNPKLRIYVEAIRQLAEKRNLTFLDLFHDSRLDLTDNGIHVRSASQQQLAEKFGQKLGCKANFGERLALLHDAVRDKHRLWYDYWRPANWKLLYGDDSRRQFTKASEGSLPFREEWSRLLPMITKAEQRIVAIANGERDPGIDRPDPEALHGDENANIAQELEAFKVAEGLSVNLFASEKNGLTSPLAVRWDPAGRMYVSVTTTYPHVFPGDVPNDKIIVLEDTDGDGQADKSTVFAEGLNIPTGLELGEGGVYVGQNSEILFLKDTDGDLKADTRRVVLSGFGNGDSHQTINSFVWSPDGELYMGQGDGIESRVETPWGSANLYQSGFYRFRPLRLQLHPLLDDFMGPGNPWGVEFDNWGQIFSIDGAGGVTHLSLGQIPAKRRLRLGRIGEPGGYCGITYMDGRHLPDRFHGQFAIGDFKANRVKCFSVSPKGAGFQLKWEPELLRSRHRNFRPVDVKTGPDGAVYVVDWYNPITCHQDDKYRDPTRDKAHGRIWRISSESKPVKAPNLTSRSIDQVVAALAATERWTRNQAKRELTNRKREECETALNRWISSLDPRSKNYEHHLYEALGAFATLEIVQPKLLLRMLEAQDPRARAFATRIAGRWHDRLENPLELIVQRVSDENPQVRMEAIAAAAAVPTAESIAVVARALDSPMDSSTQYVFKQAVHHLKKYWEPALKQGSFKFSQAHHLAEILHESGGESLIDSLREVANSADLSPREKLGAIEVLISIGDLQEVVEFAFNSKHYLNKEKYDAKAHARILKRTTEVVQSRKLPPCQNSSESLLALMSKSEVDLQVYAIELAGLWKQKDCLGRIQKFATIDSGHQTIRETALRAFVRIEPELAKASLKEIAEQSSNLVLRTAAVESIVEIDLQLASLIAARMLNNQELQQKERTRILNAFLNRDNGVTSLAVAIESCGLKEARGKETLRALFSTGRSDARLLSAINKAIGAELQTPEYSKKLLRKLAIDASRKGDANQGAVIFNSLACNSCHRVSGSGNDVGPDLTSIGTTLSSERIAEELLWPNRQVKEGYNTLLVATDDGRIHSGYVRRTRSAEESGDIVLQDISTKKLITIKRENIDAEKNGGSPMPAGLTSLLTDKQLLDLIKYLSGLGELQE